MRTLIALGITAVSVALVGCGTTTIPVGGGTGAGARIASFSADPGTIVTRGSSVRLTVEATPRVAGPLTYSWSASGGAITGEGPAVTWTAPNTSGVYSVAASVGEAGQPDAEISLNIRVKNTVRLP